MIELRKMRILMRGIKIGKKKGGGKVSLMDVFETKVDDDFWSFFSNEEHS